jgi:hypothetical protein
MRSRRRHSWRRGNKHLSCPDSRDGAGHCYSSRTLTCQPPLRSTGLRRRAARCQYADGATCRALQIGSTSHRARCSSAMKAFTSCTGCRAPPGRNTRLRASGPRWSCAAARAPRARTSTDLVFFDATLASIPQADSMWRSHGDHPGAIEPRRLPPVCPHWNRG